MTILVRSGASVRTNRTVGCAKTSVLIYNVLDLYTYKANYGTVDDIDIWCRCYFYDGKQEGVCPEIRVFVWGYIRTVLVV